MTGSKSFKELNRKETKIYMRNVLTRISFMIILLMTLILLKF